MPEEFQYDVFLNHSSKDNAVGRAVAEQLRKDRLKEWIDEWECPLPAGAREGGLSHDEGRGVEGDNIPAKIEEGLERIGEALAKQD